MKQLHIAILATTTALFSQGCSGDPDETAPTRTIPAAYDPGQPYSVSVTGADLSASITNAFFPAPVGASWTYEAQTAEGIERIEVSVPAETKDLWGTSARLVRDTVYVADQMVEDTSDWYGQDGAGNVWYLGEDTAEYENGVLLNHNGAWESGVNDALPGVNMLADPQIGDAYRQEYLVGEAEDYAIVMSLDETVTVPAGTFTGCLKTNDKSAIDTLLDEYKYYCPGVGNVLVEEGSERVELIAFTGL